MTLLTVYLFATLVIVTFWLVRVRLPDPRRYSLVSTACDLACVALAWPLVAVALVVCLVLSVFASPRRRIIP